MDNDFGRSALARYGRIVTSTTLSVVLATSMTPTVALANQTDGSTAADQAASMQAADVAQPASIAKPASEDEVAVGCLLYRLDDSDNTACVVDFEDYSGRPDNLIIPSTIEVGGTTYTVTAIGDADEVSRGQICGKESLTIPATVTTLHGIPFAMEGDYYFLGKAPQVPDEEASTFYMMWGGWETLDEGNVYCLAEYLSGDDGDAYEWNEYSFADWESALNIIWASSIFAIPESIQLQDNSGEDKTGSEVTLLADQPYQLKANSQPSYNASKFVDFQTAVTWSSSDESVAKVDETGKVEVQSLAAAGSKATITATNALGLSSSMTIVAGNSTVKTDISTLTYTPQSIGDVYLGLPSLPAVTVKDDAYELIEGKDFTVSYEKADGTPLAGLDAIDAAGSYNLVITGAGENYEGTIKVSFNVVDWLTCGDWTFRPISTDTCEIVAFDGAASAGNVVVPAQLDGYTVTKLAAGSLSNAKAADGAIVVPDTVQSIDPTAFEGAQAKAVKLLGGVSAGQEAVTLPKGTQVTYFGDEAAFKAVFGEGCSYAVNDVPWVYQVRLSSDNAAEGVIAVADGTSAYRGESGAKTQVTVPSSIDGVAIGKLGAGALSGLELAVLTVPGSVAQLGEGSLDGLSGVVRFEGACDASAKPGDVAKARIYYASDQEESWKLCDWVKPAGSYDVAWDMAYDADARGWTVKGCSDSATDLAIPEKYCGSSVVAIAAGAFPAAGNLTSVCIPSSVRSIADGAFVGITCDVTFDDNPPVGESYRKEFVAADGSTADITLRYRLSRAVAWQASEWVTGGAYRTEVYGECVAADYTYASTDTPGEYVITGYNGSSTSIQLPSTISDVAAQVDGADATISGTVVGIADEAFNNRRGMKQIIIPGTVRSIGQAAFFNCRALDCVLIQGNALETIGEQAFWYTDALTSIDLPASVKSIGSGAFISKALTDINIAQGGQYYQSIDGVVLSADGTHLAVYPMGRTDEFYRVPDGVTHIDDQAFRGDHENMAGSGLKEVGLPDGLQSIGWRAFCNVKTLETISIPDSVTDLGTYAFEFDYKLTNVKLPAGLTEIPAGLLSRCESLTSIDIPAGVTAIGERAFDTCPLAQFSLPAGLKTIGELAFDRCQIENLVLPASLESIDDHAFYRADKIKSIDFAENGSLKTLGIGVFAQCDSLTEVTIPNTIETMGNAVFGTCIMLGKVAFEPGCKLTEIPHGAFEYDSALREITLPASIKRVDDMAFWNCMGLKDAGDGEPGRVIFLNQGEWELGSNVFTYGNSCEPYEVNALGYKDSSTPTFFSEDRFGSLDIMFNDNDMPDTANVALHDSLELSVSAYAEHGDITYQWFINEEPVEGATDSSFTYVGDEKGTFAISVRAYNSYDPDAPAMLASRVVVGNAAEVAIDRLAGEQASDTAAEIAASAFPNGSDWVVIAREDDFRDAMSATGLAGALDAPILLTDRNGLSDATVSAILRLGAKHAYVIGGTGAMPGDFEVQLAELGVQVGSDLRVYGEEAEDTAVECAKLIAQIDGAGESAVFDKAIVTMQDNFADALSMSSFAYKYHVPILLETSGSSAADRALNDDAVQLLTKGAFAGATVYVPGGRAAVSDESLAVLGRGDGELVRLTEGETAYDTSNAIANYLVDQGFLSARTVTVAAGYLESNGVDALAGAALAGKADGTVLLVNGTENDGGVDKTTVEGFLTDKADYVRELHVLGGVVVMPEGIVDAMKDAVKRS